MFGGAVDVRRRCVDHQDAAAVAASTSTLSRPTPARATILVSAPQRAPRRRRSWPSEPAARRRRPARQTTSSRSGPSTQRTSTWSPRASTVDSASLSAINTTGRLTPDSLMCCHFRAVGGRIASVDVTIVGSGPNGLSAAVICARAGLSVHVIEAQPTAGRRRANGRGPGIPRCGARHLFGGAPIGTGVPVLRRVRPASPRRFAGGPRYLIRKPTAQRSRRNRLPGPGTHMRRTPTTAIVVRVARPPGREPLHGVLSLFLGDKRSIPKDIPPPRCRSALRLLQQGTPAWGMLPRRGDARALFTGVAAHTISRMPSLMSSGASQLAWVGHAVGWPVPVGGCRRP